MLYDKSNDISQLTLFFNNEPKYFTGNKLLYYKYNKFLQKMNNLKIIVPSIRFIKYNYPISKETEVILIEYIQLLSKMEYSFMKNIKLLSSLSMIYEESNKELNRDIVLSINENRYIELFKDIAEHGYYRN